MRAKVLAGRTVLAGLLALCLGTLTGCGGGNKETAVVQQEQTAQEETEGGVLLLRVNPEIAIEYDAEGRVTAVRGLNDEGRSIVADYQDYMGKKCREVVSELVGVINEAGYFVEEVEGQGRKITIEIESGSVTPEPDFLEQIAADVQQYVEEMQVNGVVSLDGETDYEIYGESSYDIQVPPADDKTAAGSGDTQQNPGGAAGKPQPGANQNDTPYTDYATPYTDYHTDNATPYTDYHTDDVTPYTDYHTDHDTPYTDYHDSHTNHDSHSNYSDYSNHD